MMKPIALLVEDDYADRIISDSRGFACVPSICCSALLRTQKTIPRTKGAMSIM